MVVDPFWFGVFCTIATEAVLLVVFGFIAGRKKH